MIRDQKRLTGCFTVVFILLCSLLHPGITAYADELPASHPSCITCKGSISPKGRWCNNHNGTITDMTTGLVWLFDAGWGGLRSIWSIATGRYFTSTITYYDETAFDRASSVKNGNPTSLTDGSKQGDWHLPTLGQFRTLFTGIEAIGPSTYFFEGIQPHYYWSSTGYTGDVKLQYMLDMSNFRDYAGIKSGVAYVWPVRRWR
ncbi:MAG: DUF1566 domain-containing protein [Deltaproteobacteria bacterium]|nr:DUF1566 domain-containing protein [Deltaproteobacteria bacterium]